jgi:hypothetical protein
MALMLLIVGPGWEGIPESGFGERVVCANISPIQSITEMVRNCLIDMRTSFFY